MDDRQVKRLAQLRQAFESGILDEDTYQAAVAALRLQINGSSMEVMASAGLLGSSRLASKRNVEIGGDVNRSSPITGNKNVAAHEPVIYAGSGASVVIGDEPVAIHPPCCLSTGIIFRHS